MGEEGVLTTPHFIPLFQHEYAVHYVSVKQTYQPLHHNDKKTYQGRGRGDFLTTNSAVIVYKH